MVAEASMRTDAPCTLWLTGLSGAGKTTLAKALAQTLEDSGRRCVVLDGDALRLGLNRDLGFSPAERSENIRRTAEVARLMNDAGLLVVAALISPLRVDRAQARLIVGARRFFEIHVSTPLDVCEAADVKGLYRKARLGELAQFTGVSAPYEAPEGPSLAIDPMRIGLGLAVAKLLALCGGTAP
ncbi:adenylyl-sulfate kinase [Variovorax paradoxus]|jgi:adenylylsulfate kinase|uniref:adenylyl-sulfate kinase n=1 Tax=Variovorax paradoxus TaxID=34073 RepID=UPI002481949A|nr:adenylyl-sulfate kinase [Variovorax paradoxus]WGT61702.1 adenylyl-sulfate kinase [Variovorax paradoxus]